MSSRATLPAVQTVGDRISVLLVDDNPVDIEAMRRAFRRHHVANELIEAHDGRDALTSLRSGRVARPFIILLDLNMPGMSGVEFLEALRKDPEHRDSVVFVLTTSDRLEDKQATYAHHIAGYIVKSDVGDDFLKLVGMLQHYCRVVELPPSPSRACGGDR